jgi:uncharacterized RDD family membrane protein YckC
MMSRGALAPSPGWHRRALRRRHATDSRGAQEVDVAADTEAHRPKPALGLEPLRARLTVLTPENVAFEFEPAGIAERALAYAVDLLVMIGLCVAIAIGGSFMAVVSSGVAMALMFVGIFLVQWWYAALFECFRDGQTLGKSLFGLRVRQRNGLRITFYQAVLRNLVRTLDLLPALYLTGVISMLLDASFRRLGDLAAGTVVVRERKAPQPSEVMPASARYNSFLEDSHVRHAARKVLAPERDVMIALGLRRERLPVAVRHALFAALAAHLERRLGVVRPPYFSEEKYVLHLTAVVLASPRF